MGEDGLKKLEEFSAATIESDEANLFALNPNMSYVPAEWLKADDFWKPKGNSVAAAPEEACRETSGEDGSRAVSNCSLGGFRDKRVIRESLRAVAHPCAFLAARVGILGSRLLEFLSLLRSLNIFPRSPTTCVVGCILLPLRGLRSICGFARFAGRRRALGKNRSLRTSRC